MTAALPLLLLALTSLSALTAALPAADPTTTPASTSLVLTNSDEFTTLGFPGGVTEQTLLIDPSAGGVFLTLRAPCWFTSNVRIGDQPKDGVPVAPCTDFSRAGGQSGSRLYYAPPGTDKVTVSVQSGFPVSVQYRAQGRDKCNEPRTTFPWNLTDPNSETPLEPTAPSVYYILAQASTHALGQYVCDSRNMPRRMRLLDVHYKYGNNIYSGKLARACQQAAGKVDNQALVGSHNGDKYGGTTLALYYQSSIVVNVADGGPHSVLCQEGQ
ncbi:hypothetical protein BCR44DRAFT_1443040 [Catenaria anguillulae PL171]|uniref:Ig-like domain-containing protein n=1 Tax=Catenaria anguillulae PL171 TaxID=765915 RepID=A0A1Y2HB24_9FUNG|nr:hypothetical protein BCR44DRAFT_1443040 [Catenaria anguillulae PL171]